MRKWGSVLVLGLILAVLLVLIFTEKQEPPPEKLTVHAVLIPFNPEAITAVNIATRGSQAGLVKEDGAWWVMPGRLKGNQLRIEYLVGALAGLEGTRVVSAADLEAYGLEQPRYRVAVRSKDGEVVKLVVGDASPVKISEQQEYYAGVSSREGIYTIPAVVAELLHAEPNYFRNLYFAHFTVAEASRISLKSPQGELLLIKEDEVWRVASTRNTVATQKVNALLDKLAFLQPDKYVNDSPTPQDLAAYGFTRPALDIRVMLEGGKAIPVQFGLQTPEGVYARRQDEPYVYLVSLDAFEGLRSMARSLF